MLQKVDITDYAKDGWVQPKGMKFDSEKTRVDLLDPQALEGLARVLTFGASKYSANNWRGGIAYSRLIGAALRHTFALMRGEDIDPESGLPHVDHLGCCWMFLSNMTKTRPDLDDRWNPRTNVGSDNLSNEDRKGMGESLHEWAASLKERGPK